MGEGFTADTWKAEWAARLEKDVVEQVAYTLIMAGVMFVGYLGKSFIFSYLGENVTFRIRQVLYMSILEKHIGWFDQQENQSSVLTSAMASESALINGVASESLAPNVEALFALVGGLIIGFIFCWQESLITLGCVPFIVVGNFVGMEFQKGLSGATGDMEKAANLLIGDAINNFKTVQSFGYEHLILKKYKEIIDPILAMSKAKHCKAGIAFGFS
jgi:ATP-binding cassette subfamily B (MDR/TAP) protein 1